MHLNNLRVLLAILAVDGAPIAALFETHHVLLASDLATNLIGTVDDVTARTNLADRHLCRILWEIFASYGKSILSYGLQMNLMSMATQLERTTQ
ncbi:hypothetical protein Pelo_1949 [Pelomyxa schiedti]|nr:hypothetical protein Pelo_1949 [Pelomyxa schiedti]